MTTLVLTRTNKQVTITSTTPEKTGHVPRIVTAPTIPVLLNKMKKHIEDSVPHLDGQPVSQIQMGVFKEDPDFNEDTISYHVKTDKDPMTFAGFCGLFSKLVK